ncbi:MAG: hypothetical protein ABFQ95_02720 [Pseudomonadota bacterium]
MRTNFEIPISIGIYDDNALNWYKEYSALPAATHLLKVDIHSSEKWRTPLQDLDWLPANLQVLWVWSLGSDTDKLASALGNLPELRELTLCKTNLTLKAIQTLTPASQNMSQLQRLSINTEKLGAGAIDLASLVSNLPNLKVLCLENCNIGPKEMEAIGPAIGTLSKLEELNLNDNQLGPEEERAAPLALALKSLQRLKSLSIGYNNFGPKGLEVLQPSISKIPSLEELCLDNGGIDINSATNLALIFKYQRKLKILSLNGNNLSNQVMPTIAPALKNLPQLRELDISNCELDAAEMEILSSVFPTFSNLRILDLSNNPLGLSGMIKLAPMLDKLTNLQDLSLKKCNIDAPAMEILAPELEKLANLEHLSSQDNPLGRNGGKALALAITKLTKLKHLNVENNNLDEFSFGALWLSLATRKEKLSYIGISGNPAKIGFSEFSDLSI